jgi:hypothetical protein
MSNRSSIEEKSSIDTITMERLQREEEEREAREPRLRLPVRSESFEPLERKDSDLSVLSAPASVRHECRASPRPPVDVDSPSGGQPEDDNSPARGRVNRKVGVWLRDRNRDSPENSSTRPSTAMSQISEGPAIMINESPRNASLATSPPPNMMNAPTRSSRTRRLLDVTNPISRLFRRLTGFRRSARRLSVTVLEEVTPEDSVEPRPSGSGAQRPTVPSTAAEAAAAAVRANEAKGKKKKKKKKRGSLARLARLFRIRQGHSSLRFRAQRSGDTEVEDDRECNSIV